MKLLPDKAIPPLPRSGPCPVFVAQPPHLLGDALVRGHRLEDLRCRQRALRVHAAPPADGLDTPLEREPPALSEKMSGLAVEALHRIAGGGKGPQAPSQAGVHVGEGRSAASRGRRASSWPSRAARGQGSCAPRRSRSPLSGTRRSRSTTWRRRRPMRPRAPSPRP